MNTLSDFVKTKRKQLGLKQIDLAEKAGVALTVIRKIEQGKENLSLAKVNHVLQMFGHVLGPVRKTMRQALVLYNKTLAGRLTEEDNGPRGYGLDAWRQKV